MELIVVLLCLFALIAFLFALEWLRTLAFGLVLLILLACMG